MDATFATEAPYQEITYVRPNDLISAFNHYADKINILSLDCFDTVLWRKTVTPFDMFFDLQNKETFKSIGITAPNRGDLEGHVRKVNYINQGISEVRLRDIFRCGYPSLSDEQVDALVEEEIATEIETCYAYPPVVDLMRAAHAKGIKIIIVSNTYLEEKQLRRLLTSCLPEDVMNSINTIFCSCEFNVAKEDGLFTHVLAKLGVIPNTILHLGDNHRADFEAPRRFGINGLHLRQFHENTKELMRFQVTAASIIDTQLRSKRSITNPFRGLLAREEPVKDKPEHLIGYFGLGSLMYCYGRYICDEIEQMRLAGKQPKVLFLMRDGYLPSLVCEALTGSSFGKRVRISRFSAIAATFRTKDDIDYYIAINKTDTIEDMCKQMLIPKSIVNKLFADMQQSTQPSHVFYQFLNQDDIQQLIFERSRDYFARLKTYLLKETDLKPGDSIVFVDIGYSGKSQQRLTPILMNEMGISEVRGLYLIALNVPDWRYSRTGLIDPSWCDDRAAVTVAKGASVIEEMCCSCDDTVIDYDQEGNPIFRESFVGNTQRAKMALLHNECLDFVRDAKEYFEKTKISLSKQNLRDYAIAELGRIAFFPTEAEIQYFQEYKHDNNRGTDVSFYLYDTPLGELISLRKQGLTFKTQNLYGLRSAGLELSLATILQQRLRFDHNLDDVNLRREWLKVITMRHKKPHERQLFASATYDGYFSLWFPVDNETTHVAIIFGINYKWLQIFSAELIKTPGFLAKEEGKSATNILPQVVYSNMAKKSDGLFECESQSATAMVALPQLNAESGMIFRIVYRPIVTRSNS